MKTKSRNLVISFLLTFTMLISLFTIAPLTAFAQGEETTPVIVSVGENIVDQETNMGGAPTVIMGQPYSVQVNATGGNLTFSAGAGEYSKLPNGLTIDAETGIISGICTELEMGRHNVYITAKNDFGEAHAVIGMWVVDNSIAPVIQTDSGSLGTIYANSFSQFTVSVQPNANYLHDIEWTLSNGTLPNGMELQYVNTSTVYINGTPTQTGTFDFTLKVENEIGTAERAFSITVQEGVVQPTIIDDYTTIPYAIVGKPYEYQLKATGTNTQSNPIIWSFKDDEFSQNSYDLGKGLTLSNTGVISGTPTEYGQVDLTSIYAKNSAGQTSTAPYLMVYENGAVTEIVVSPEETVVPKGGSKQFTAQVFGYGDVSQEITSWDTSMYVPELSGWFPRPTSSDTKIVNGVLTVGEDEERSQIMVVAIVGNEKGYAMVTIAEKADVIYQVAFDKNGGDGTMNSVPVVENGTYKLPACGFTAPTGYEFKCWSVNEEEKAVDAEISITADTTVKAVWKAKSYTITFDTDGGSVVAPITQDYGTTVTAPNAPTKTGYTFKGWNQAVPSTMPAENMTITATWEINEYTITFNTNGGTTIAAITQDYNTAVQAPANPTKEGHTFKQWDKTIPATMPAENITITAEWDINQYTITFDTDGGSAVAPITQDYGTVVVAPANPTKSGYTFTGWDKTIPSTMPAENMTITAQWTEIVPNTYTVTYTDGVDGVELFADQVNANVTEGTATPTFNGTPVREGYTFAGWTPSVANTVTANATYTATWTINQYTITFNTDGGSTIDPITQNYGTAVVAPANPTKDGYTFAGWDKTIPSTMPAENVTITASWNLIPVHEHTDADGQWESDGTYHWHTCSCTEQFDMVACSGGTATCTAKAVCTVCNNEYGNTTDEHSYGAWTSNGDGTHTRVCSLNAEHKENGNCAGGTATCTEKAVCATCNTAYGNTAAHSHGSEWKTDANEHWNECVCGDKANKAAHTDSNNDGKCDTCEYQMSTTPDNPDNPNNTPDNPNNTPDDPNEDKDGLGAGAIVGIVIGSVAVVGIGGFALFWFVIKKKSWADFLAIFKKK